MKKTIKTLFAVIGAFFVVIIAISIIVTLGMKDTLDFGDKVAIVEVEGIITDPVEINRKIREYAARDDVKALLIRINSPGGAVGPSQEIYREIIRLKGKKTVVVSMGSVAASGGYYIASAADKIVANPGTITGSIGVIIEFINLEDLFGKIGLRGYVLKSGKFKDLGSPLRKMTQDEEALIQEMLADVHRQFIEDVALGRGMDTEAIERIADGRILSGAQAKSLGLVDSLGNLEDAIELSATLAGIEGEPSVIYPEKEQGLMGALFGESAKSLIDLATGLRVMYMMPTFSR
jgi:protease-4